MAYDVQLPKEFEVASARESDAAEILVLQRCCWVSEAILNETLDIPALHESLSDVVNWVAERSVWTLRREGRLIGVVRAHGEAGSRWEIGRLMMAPDFAGQGLARWLLAYAEKQAPDGVTEIALFSGGTSPRNIRMYQRAGYHLTDPPSEELSQHIRGAVFLRKTITRP